MEAQRKIANRAIKDFRLKYGLSVPINEVAHAIRRVALDVENYVRKELGHPPVEAEPEGEAASGQNND